MAQGDLCITFAIESKPTQPRAVTTRLQQQMTKNNVTYSRFRMISRLCAVAVFVIALSTYLLTIDPSASYWDCPEYIAVAHGLQIGHSPGNPIWMLAARTAATFAPDAQHIALAINITSALFTALTSLCCFLTTVLIINLIRFGNRRKAEGEGMSAARVITTLGAAAAASLAFTWCDSVWFSAVEAEVYAFSTFLTALTFYVVLLWSWNYRCEPHGDRRLVLAAYLTGIGMGVHELNLLLLPALAITIWFTVRHRQSAWRSWLSLIVGSAAVVLILFVFIPAFFRFAQWMELLAVNKLGYPFHTGLLAAWISVFLILSGAAAILSASRRKSKTVRIARLSFWCALLFFIGFSSYALIIIRANANPPINTGRPADIFSFSRYYSREQYGSTPLFYGPAFGAKRLFVEEKKADGKKHYNKYYNTHPSPRFIRGEEGDKGTLRNGFASAADSLQSEENSRRKDDFYVLADYDFQSEHTPEMNMWLPRMCVNKSDEIDGYYSWSGMEKSDMLKITSPTLAVTPDGKRVEKPNLKADTLYRPTYLHNFSYMLSYQISYMYLRYLAWNFIGRQNDIPGHGEPDAGLPITGIDAADSLWTGPMEITPPEAGKENPGRNVYWFMPLALGLAGAIWQVRQGRRGRCSASAIGAVFFFTGVAIVFYLNQTTVQARDRDYAFIGSYYAFCLWIGLGTMPLYTHARRLLKRSKLAAAIASGVALIVPLQMLSQTADDHDRSRRTATSDMAHNILAPLEKDAVLFVSGDNNTFPIWYSQNVEETRRDVRIVSLIYLSDNEMSASLTRPVYESAPLQIQMPRPGLRMSRYAYASLPADTTWQDAYTALRRFYDTQSSAGYPRFTAARVYIPFGNDTVRIDLRKTKNGATTVRQELLLLLDIISSDAKTGYKRPLYWIKESGDGIFGGQLKPYMRHVGPVLKLSPGDTSPADDKVASDALSIYRYGGADCDKAPYYDPLTAERISLFRRTLIAHASGLSRRQGKAERALQLIRTIQKRIPEKAVAWHSYALNDSTYTDEGIELALALARVADSQGSSKLKAEAVAMLRTRLEHAKAWRKYRRALPTSWQKYISDNNRGISYEVPRVTHLLDSLQSTGEYQ